MERYRLDKTKRNQFKTNNPKGCDHCKGTGYSEFPCPIAEILKMNPQVRDLMLQKLPSRQFEARAMAASESETLWQAGIAKLYEGEISLAELIRCVNVPEFGIAI
jgi:type II secretory ATPase GspE/PulE/Tfp pilus assembly ATPase PilB-like protein